MVTENVHEASPTLSRLLRIEQNFTELLRLANDPATRDMPLQRAVNQIPSIAGDGGANGVPVTPAAEPEQGPEQEEPVLVPGAPSDEGVLDQMLRSAIESGLTFQIEVPPQISAIIALYPLIASLADDLRVGTTLPSGEIEIRVQRDVAAAILMFFDRHSAAVVAVSEFFAWVFAMADPNNIPIRNLDAVGLGSVMRPRR